MKVLVTQPCLTLCNSIDCSPLGPSVHGNLHTRILEWVAIPFSRGSSQPRNQTQVSCNPGGFLTVWATKEAPIIKYKLKLQWCNTSHQSEWPSLKTLKITNVGEDIEKREPSYTVDGNLLISWYSHYAEQYGGSSEK